MEGTAITVKPKHNNVIIKPDHVPDKAGNILLSREVAQKLKQVGQNIYWGAVAAVGPGLRHPVPSGYTTVPCDVNIGDRVMYNMKFVIEVLIGEEIFHVITENHVICAE